MQKHTEKIPKQIVMFSKTHELSNMPGKTPKS